MEPVGVVKEEEETDKDKNDIVGRKEGKSDDQTKRDAGTTARRYS